MSFSDLLVHPSTRRRGLELSLLGHYLLTPNLLFGRAQPRMSPPARVLIGIIDEGMACARVDLMAHTLIQLRFARGIPCCSKGQEALYGPEPKWIHLVRCTQRARYSEVVRMAQAVSRLTVADLSFLSVDVVLEWLGAKDVTAPTSPSSLRLSA